MREPAQERQAEMRFNQAPAVGCSKVHNTIRCQHTSNFVQMMPLRVSISHMFDDMVADHDVECVVGIGQCGSINDLECIALGDDAVVDNVDCMHIGVATGRSEENTSELQSLMTSTYAVVCMKTQIKQRNEYSHISHTNT